LLSEHAWIGGCRLKIVVLGLSITSSWGNGHATNYRALCRALAERDHELLFLERDVPWYHGSRDFDAPFVHLYSSLAELRRRFADDLRRADLVVVGSFVPEGVEVGEWALATSGGVVAFWDLDTPVTAEKLAADDREYLSRDLAGRYDLYLSFTGGPLLERLGARRPLPFHCLVDADRYRPLGCEPSHALGYLGTYSADRQAALERLLLEPARRLPKERFVVGGPQYPESLTWPANVERRDHVAPGDHAGFYAAQRLTLNVTRRPMVDAGWSPSVRLFEAAACGVAVVSDPWRGLETFFVPDEEILVARSAADVVRFVTELDPDERADISRRARARVLAEHAAERRAEQLEAYVAKFVEAAA
jgi:spore maturation protein CgeB